MVIGITGGIGSGKSLVARAMCDLDKSIVYYHADEQAKILMNTSFVVKNQLISVFGENSYLENQLNRKYISSLVFNQPKLLQRLHEIVHPVLKNHFIQFIKSQKKNTLILFENAILFEAGSDSICDVIITVNAPLNRRINRVIKRDNTTEQDVKNRINNQWPDIKRNLLSNYIINNIEKSETLLKIKKIYNILTKKSINI